MATKNLSRTVIEGGRVRSNKWDRRHSSREERAKNREFLSKIKKDPDAFDEDMSPKRKKVYKEFDDKLGPVYRWIRSQVGRKWDEVKSEVFETFDTRNLAGKHVVYDHLISSVQEKEDIHKYRYINGPEDTTTSYWKNQFYVDQDGILQEKTYLSRREKRVPVHTKIITDWINGRIIGKVGKKLYWFIPVSSSTWAEEWKCEWKGYFDYDDVARRGQLEYYKLYYLTIRDVDGNIINNKPEWRAPIYFKYKKIAARQSLELSKGDMEMWNQIPEWCQKTILQWDPNNPNPPEANKYSYYW